MFPTLVRQVYVGKDPEYLQGLRFAVGNAANLIQIELPEPVIYDFHFELTSVRDRIVLFRKFEGADPVPGLGQEYLALPSMQKVNHTVSAGYSRSNGGWGIQMLVADEDSQYGFSPNAFVEGELIFGKVSVVPRQ